MTCCRCNRSGICRNCSCVRERKSCSSCLPQHHGRCLNVDNDGSMETEAGHNCDQTEAASEATQEERAGERQVHVSQIGGDGDCNDQIQAELPFYPPTSRPNFTWGEIDGTTAKNAIDQIYDEIVH